MGRIMANEEFIEIHELEINKDSIYITMKTKLWCTLPYKNNKNGCYHYNNNLLCPPNSPYFGDYINNYNHFYLIYAIFDFKTYKEIKKIEKPNKTDAQIGCLRYWQGSIKKLLKLHIKHIYINNFHNISNLYLLGCGSGFKDKFFVEFQQYIYSMESVGINVFRTLKNNNINFDIKAINTVVLVCLLCSKIEINNNIERLI